MSAEPRLVHVDEHLAVVDKPAGLVVHAAPGHHGDTLVDALGDLLGGGEPERPGIVHRLDRDTSGLLIVARDAEAHRRLAAMIKRREPHRAYRALIEGRPRSRTGTIDAPLGRDPRAPERRAVRGRGSRPARTHFTVLETLPADSLVEARLETGRTHQIRAHFAAISHPVAGDPRYGHRRASWARAPVPTQRRAPLRRTRSPASGSRSPPSCRRISRRRSSGREQG